MFHHCKLLFETNLTSQICGRSCSASYLYWKSDEVFTSFWFWTFWSADHFQNEGARGVATKIWFCFPSIFAFDCSNVLPPLSPYKAKHGHNPSPRCTQGEVWSSVHGEDAIIIPINVESLCGKCMSELFVTVASEIKI